MNSWIAWMFVALAAIPLLNIAWTKLFDPVRMKFADLGFRLLHDPKLNDKDKERVEQLLDDAFKGHKTVLLALMIWPAIIVLAVMKILGVEDDDTLFDRLNAHETGEKFLSYHALCVLGANPIAGFLFIVQAVPALIVMIIAAGSYGAAKHFFVERLFGPFGTAKRI